MKGKLTTNLPKTRTYETKRSKVIDEAHETEAAMSAANEEVFIKVP